MTFSGREPHTWHNPDEAEVSKMFWVIVPPRATPRPSSHPS